MLVTKKDLAYKKIKEMILQGDLTPDSTLSEKKLADELGMSRTPVREALQKLVMEKFMRGFSRRGSMVNEISIAEAIEIIELRMAVEEFVIQSLSLPLSDEQCRKLQAMIDFQKELTITGNSTAFLDVDVEFHDYLASLYGNQLLRDTLKRARERFLAPGGVILRNKPQMMEALEGHVKILDALRRGDPEEAKRQMHAHMVFAKRVLIS